MQNKIEALRQKVQEDLQKVKDQATLSQFWQMYLSKNGQVPSLMKELKNVAKEERPLMGKLINEVKNDVQALYDKAAEEVKKAELAARNAAETVDITLPAKTRPAGGLHPLTLVRSEIIDAFAGMGFRCLKRRKSTTTTTILRGSMCRKITRPGICRIPSI